MILAKRLVFFLFGFLIFFFIAFWGFKTNFPSKSISRLLQKNFTKHTGFPIEINGLKLGWQKISTEEISIFSPDLINDKSERRLLIFDKLESPFWTIFTNGEIIIEGNVHGGKIKVSSKIFSQKYVDLYLKGLKLEKVPYSDINSHIFVTGDLSLSAKIVNFEEFRKGDHFFPEGNIKGELRNSEIIFSDTSSFLDFEFPKLNFSEIFFDFKIGNLISINSLKLNGSLDGKIDGIIQLNKYKPSMSLLDINLKIIPSTKIKEKINSFSPILLPLQCEETINVNIKGPLRRINFPTRNKC